MTIAATSSRSQQRHGNDPQAIAIFDLDGTLITRDSLLPFLSSFAWRHKRKARILIIPAVLVLYALRIWPDQRAKQKLLVSICGGYSAKTIQAHAEWFCRNWVAGHQMKEAVQRLRQHQANGDRIILLSASPSVYVPQVARFFGIDEVICTEVGFEQHLCTGGIIGRNCKGSAKLEMLKAHLGDDDARFTYGYGDSESDMELLRWTRHGVLVSKRRLVAIN